MANTNLSAAKSAKDDGFYTQFADIRKEVNADLENDVLRFVHLLGGFGGGE